MAGEPIQKESESLRIKCFKKGRSALSSSAGAATWKAPGIYGEEMKCLALGEDWWGSFLSDGNAGRGHCSLSNPFPQRASRWVPHLSLLQPG